MLHDWLLTWINLLTIVSKHLHCLMIAAVLLDRIILLGVAVDATTYWNIFIGVLELLHKLFHSLGRYVLGISIAH